MSNIKKLLGELQDDLLAVKGFINIRDLKATEFLNQKAFVDKEWEQHEGEHFLHPSTNCHFCVQNADLPSQADIIQDQEFRWGEEREVYD